MLSPSQQRLPRQSSPSPTSCRRTNEPALTDGLARMSNRQKGEEPIAELLALPFSRGARI